MKLTIEITEEDAAAIWADNWGSKSGKTLVEMIEADIALQGFRLRKAFPEDCARAMEELKQNGTLP